MSDVIHVVGSTLLHFLWQGALISLTAAAVLRLLRRASSRSRYAIACGALATMLATPVVTAQWLSTRSPVRVANDAPTAVRWTETSFFVAPPLARITGAAAESPQSSAFTMDSVLPFVVMLWIAGATILMVRLAGGWLRVRRLYTRSLAMSASRWQSASERVASHLGLNRVIRVVDSALVDTPIVVGWLRPIVLLPIAALAQLTPAQVNAILAHELAHVRRHDFIVNVVQTLAETLLFYHPAVWWISARIRAEREHCCDEIAVAVCGDAVGYAAALTELETWRAGRSTFALAATSGSLLNRVRRVLGSRTSETPRVMGVVTILGLVLLFIVAGGAVPFMFARQADTPATTNKSRGVATSRDAVVWNMLFDHSTGQMTFRGFTGRELIRFAYQLPMARVVGGPSWIDSETFDLSTRVDHAPAADEMPALVRELLEQRFGLITHQETLDFPVYALVIARADGALGPNLQPTTSDCFDHDAWIASGKPATQLRDQRVPLCGVWDGGISRTTVRGTTMARFASRLWSDFRAGRQLEVIDRTGLSGTFDVTLDYFRPAAAIMAQTPSLERVFEPLGFVSFPKALEKQLGLKLEDATAPYDVIVIDRAQRPARVVAAAKQAPATQVPRRLVYKASDGVVLPVPLKRVEPEYPASAQQVRMQGTVVVTMVVLPDGTPDDVRATKPLDRLLDELAVRAAREWRFRPGTKDGQPVAVEVSIEMGFALRGPTYKAGVDGVSLPVPVKRVEPAYPEAEQNAGIQGVVTLEAVVLPDGTVGKTSVVAPLDPALDEQALQAMKQWQFKPGTKDGEAVPVRVAVEMSFRLR